MNSLMRLDKEYNWINKKRNAQKKKKYTKFHKIRASFSLTLFIHLDIYFFDSFFLCKIP